MEIPNKLKSKCFNFPNIEKLNAHLEQSSLEPYETRNKFDNLQLMQSLLYDSLDFEYLVNDNFMIFQTDNNSSFYGEASGAEFCMLRVRRKNVDLYLTFIQSKTKQLAGAPL